MEVLSPELWSRCRSLSSVWSCWSAACTQHTCKYERSLKILAKPLHNTGARAAEAAMNTKIAILDSRLRKTIETYMQAKHVKLEALHLVKSKTGDPFGFDTGEESFNTCTTFNQTQSTSIALQRKKNRTRPVMTEKYRSAL